MFKFVYRISYLFSNFHPRLSRTFKSVDVAHRRWGEVIKYLESELMSPTLRSCQSRQALGRQRRANRYQCMYGIAWELILSSFTLYLEVTMLIHNILLRHVPSWPVLTENLLTYATKSEEQKCFASFSTNLNIVHLWLH